MKPSGDTIVLSVVDPKDGELIGVVRAKIIEPGLSALLYILPLNPRCIKDAEAWMVHSLPEAVNYLINEIGLSEIYANLPPSSAEAIEGYVEFGFKYMKPKECYRQKGVTYVSLYYHADKTVNV